MAESKMTFRFLGSLKRARDLYCSGGFGDLNSNKTSICITNNKYLGFCYGLNYEDYQHGDSDNDPVEYEEDEHGNRKASIRIPLPNIHKTLVGPKVVNSLTLDLTTLTSIFHTNYSIMDLKIAHTSITLH
jgi:hypothetical protein